MKVFWNVLAAIFSIAFSAGLVILIAGNFEIIIQSFYENPFETALTCLGSGSLFFSLSFFPLHEFIDDNCF